ncbi:MAG TPA: MBL fold metallo-hydrolase [Steroidobacteraceae bacterium]|nr:MBL fold metallo-hydrolase [Steroidobacteraceae bacterium]
MIELTWRLIEAGHCIHPEASTRTGASMARCEFPALVALLRHPARGWILFDTGYGEAFMQATRRMPEALYRCVTPVRLSAQQSAVAQLHRLGIKAGDIGTVVLSHLHGDHVGGLADFGDSKVWCSHEAWQDMHGRSRLAALARGLLPDLVPLRLQDRLTYIESAPLVRLPAELAPFAAGHDLFGDGSLLAVALPGHAAGHFGVCFRNSRQWVFLVADAAWSAQAITDNVPPPGWATALLGDTRLYRATLADLHRLAACRSGVLLVPAHCRSFRP